jgi:parvulin-like peptidyl-prolyl isomerase
MTCHRLLATTLALTLLGCGWHQSSWTRTAQLGSPRVSALPARSQEPESGQEIQQTSLVVQPSLKAAALPTAALPEAEGRITASVLARVNGQPILAEEVQSAASGQLLEVRDKIPQSQWAAAQAEIMKFQLDRIIERELILQDATARIPPRTMEKVKEAAQKEFDNMLKARKKQLKVKSDEEMRAFLDKHGIVLEDERRQHERSFIATEYVRARIRDKIESIEREQVLEYYQKNPKEFDRPERVVWQHIFIDVDRFRTPAAARQHAEMVLAKVKAIQKAEEFGPLAEQYSHGPSRYRNGEGEGQERGQIRPVDLEALVFTLKPGQTSALVETPNGFHIARVAEHHKGGKVPLEQAYPDIRKKLQGQIGQAEYAKFIKELRAKAYIENAFAK